MFDLPIHLPEPNICPLCNVVHWTLKQDPMTLWEDFFVKQGVMQRGEDIRPYYATFLGSKLPRALWQSALTTSNITVPSNGYYAGHAHTRCGEYTGSPSYFSGGGTAWWVQLVINAGAVASSGPGVTFNGFHNMGETDFYAAIAATYYGAGSTVSVSAGAQSNTPDGYIHFVPTPTYPQ